MNSMTSVTVLFTKKVRDADTGTGEKRGMKGMFKKPGRRTRESEQAAPPPPLEGDPVPKGGADAEAVARAVLDALNAHDPL
jgi:hypothetical protein